MTAVHVPWFHLSSPQGELDKIRRVCRDRDHVGAGEDLDVLCQPCAALYARALDRLIADLASQRRGLPPDPATVEPDPTPAHRPLDDLREECRLVVRRAQAAHHAPGVMTAVDAVVPVVVEHIAAHFDRAAEADRWRQAYEPQACDLRLAAREIRSTYGQ